jgi:hypothetical protein
MLERLVRDAAVSRIDLLCDWLGLPLHTRVHDVLGVVNDLRHLAGSGRVRVVLREVPLRRARAEGLRVKASAAVLEVVLEENVVYTLTPIEYLSFQSYRVTSQSHWIDNVKACMPPCRFTP